MTTTISKHDLQHQQQQQQQLMLLQQQQQQLILLQQQQQQQQQRFSQNTTYSSDNTITASMGLVATATTNHLDNITTTTLPNTIQIDTLNNNLENDFNTTLTLQVNAINNNDVSSISTLDAPPPTKVQKKRSLLSFKSFDFHFKSLYSGLRYGSSNQNKSRSQTSNLMTANSSTGEIGEERESIVSGVTANGSELNANNTQDNRHHHNLHPPYNRMPPYLKIESVDDEESENLLIDYPNSPYSSRRNSSNDDNRLSSQLINLNSDSDSRHLPHHLQQLSPYRYEMARSRASSPSPYFLSPHNFTTSSQNMRRSSTSDIMSSSKRSTSSFTSNSRRPSTSDLLRRARERRGSESRMGGRSVSHGGLPRGGGGGGAFRAGPGIGGRRTSIAF